MRARTQQRFPARARQRPLRSDAGGREGVTDARADLGLRRTYATARTARAPPAATRETLGT